ncbi:MAG TPA: hypothetical protein VFB31_02370 [Pseudolabrys sp.]|nr:hypothetical protein [Pseudolabrys sp.]
MPENFSEHEIAAIPLALSQPRFATYLTATNNDRLRALQLYHWNALLSAAFLFPLHVFEICIRNAAANAIGSKYNARWPWSAAFEMSLPVQSAPWFSPRNELRSVRQRHQAAGKVIADVRFAFWESMYTRRHDGRLWQPFLRREFPNIPSSLSIAEARSRIHQAAGQVRELRNRIAHHEPIFQRSVDKDYVAIKEIVAFRCLHTATWMDRSQSVTDILAEKP